MPQVTLAFPDGPDNPSEGDASRAFTAPKVTLHLSLRERAWDWFDARFRPEHARLVEQHRERWRAGIIEEVAFWDGFLASRGNQWPDEYVRRMDPALPLQEELAELVDAPDGATVRILDVGAGPFTWVGRTSPKWRIQIVPIDPLADAYDALFQRHDIAPPVQSIQCAAEEMGRRFAPRSFDIAVARNSLDHALDPLLAIRTMVSLVRPQGAVFLLHSCDEATKNYWNGLHQWNFAVVDGDFVISDRETRVNVTQLLGKDVIVSNTILAEENWITTVIRRLR